MESRLHRGHWRGSRSSPFFSQSFSILSDEAESAIKIIVVYRGSAPSDDPPRSELEAGSLLLKKNIDWRRKRFSAFAVTRSVFLEDWPVYFDFTPGMREPESLFRGHTGHSTPTASAFTMQLKSQSLTSRFYLAPP